MLANDVLAGVLFRLQRDGAELRQDLAGLRVGDPGDVADREDLRVPGKAEIRLRRDAASSLQFDAEGLGDWTRLQPRPPDERMRLEHFPGLQRHPGRRDGSHDLVDEHLDAALFELLLGVRAEIRLEHPEEIRGCFDHDDARVLLRQVRVILGEVGPEELRHGSCGLDSSWATAHDDDVQQTICGERWFAIGGRPLLRDMLLEADGITERVHGKRILLCTLDPEEVDLGAQGDDEVVVLDRCDRVELNLSLRQIDPGDRGLAKGEVRLLVEEIAQRVPDDLCLE